MRIYLGIVLGFFLCQFDLVGQSNICGSTFDNEHKEHFLKVKRDLTRSGLRSEETTFIPVKFHLVGTADGEGRLSFEDALDQLCILNANFAAQDIKFYMKDGDINELDDNTIYNNPASAAGATKMAIEKNASGQNAINVFFANEAQSDGLGITLGYYSFNQDLLVIKKSVAQSSSQINFVLGHEVGHFFSLPHTFNGWDNEPWDGTPVTSSFSPGGEKNELVDGSNCEDAGDMICDTPADYNLGFGWDGCRDYDGGCTDLVGALLSPQESNFMGYFIGCDEYIFSDDQKAIIKNDYDSPRRSYLRVSYQPSDDPITETPVTLGPEDGSTTPFFNGVELTWTEVPNATHYFLELSQGLFKSYYKVEDTKIFLSDLKSDRSYRWKVKPYNEINTCSSFSAASQFRTGTMTTSNENIDLEAYKINVFPNPSQGDLLNISFSEALEGEFNVSLVDVTGKTIYAQTVRAENYVIDHLRLDPGLYLLKITQKDFIITKKVIVNE